MFKTLRAKYVLAEMTVSEKNVYLYKNLDFYHQHYKNHPNEVPLGC